MPPRAAARHPIAVAAVTFRDWQRRRSYRRELERLLRLGTWLIEDIGLTADQARAEIAKPFWRR